LTTKSIFKSSNGKVDQQLLLAIALLLSVLLKTLRLLDSRWQCRQLLLLNVQQLVTVIWI